MGKKILVKEVTFNLHSSKGFGWEHEAQARKWKGRGEKIEQLPACLAVGTSNSFVLALILCFLASSRGFGISSIITRSKKLKTEDQQLYLVEL